MAIIVRKILSYLAVLGIGFAVWSCEPATLTDARNQLGRGPADTVEYVLPLSRDTLDVSDFDIENLTEIGDLQGIALDPETVHVAIGEELDFENVQLTDFFISLPPVAVTTPGSLDTTFTYAGLDDPRVDPIDSLTFASGSLDVTTGNRLVESMDYTITLHGIERSGVPLTGSGTVPGAVGNGSWAIDQLSIDLAGATMVPDSVQVELRVQVTLTGNPANGANADSAIVQSGLADFRVQSVSGNLDPSVTPELAVVVEDSTVLDNSIVGDLGEFEDVVRGSALNTALADLEILNQAEVPITLNGFTLGAVVLVGGAIPRDPSTGEPLYETDDQGQPILVPITDPGMSTLSIPRAQGATPGTKTVQLSWPELATRVVHLLIDGDDVAIIGAGIAAAGDSTPATLTDTDSLRLLADMAIGIDFTIPDTGLVVTSNNVSEALTFDSQEDIDDILDNLLIQASAVAEVDNGTPYALEIDIAFAAGDLGDQDVFQIPGASIIAGVTVAAPALSSEGRVTTPVIDTTSVTIPVEDVEPLLAVDPGEGVPEPKFTATVRARMRSGLGGGGRAALGVDDVALVISGVVIEVKRGGAQ
jgi:hypothetical protein